MGAPSNKPMSSQADWISVAVDDASPLCPAVSSEVETYSKVTIVEASNN